MPDEDNKTPRPAQASDIEPGEDWVEDDAGEWVDEAAEAEWVEESQPVDDKAKGSRKPKQLPPYTSWLAGLAGLLLGLFAFRSCG